MKFHCSYEGKDISKKCVAFFSQKYERICVYLFVIFEFYLENLFSFSLRVLYKILLYNIDQFSGMLFAFLSLR